MNGLGHYSSTAEIGSSLYYTHEEVDNHKEMSIEGMGIDVGLLREQWTLPSDHLPIGITLAGINIASWNVLNTEYIKYAIADHSGLNKSTLTLENNIIHIDGLTERDQHVLNLILGEMLVHTQHSRDIIALQECGKAFVHHLKAILPPHMALIPAAEHETDQSVIIYNTENFNCLNIEVLAGLFTDRPKRTIMNILLQEKKSKKLYRFLTAHLPWIPDGPAAKQLADYLKDQLSKNSMDQETMVLMGDLNKTEKAIERSFLDSGLNDFQQISPYSTFIPFFLDGTYTRSACFDHFFIFANHHVKVEVNSPDEVLDGLNTLANKLL